MNAYISGSSPVCGFSSQLGAAVARPDDGSPLRVRLRSPRREILFDQTLMPVNGELVVEDLRQMVESWLEHENLPDGEFWLHFGETVLHFEVCYCRANMGDIDAPDWVAANFLTLSQSRLIAADGEATVYSWALDDDPAEAETTLTYDLGGESVVTKGPNIPMFEVTTKVRGMRISPREFKNLPHLRSIELRLGERNMLFFIDPSPRELDVEFANAFNLPERAQFPAGFRTTTEVSRSMASINRRLSQYDFADSHTQTVECATLTHAEVCWLADLAASRKVVRHTPGGRVRTMLITDMKHEVSGDPSQPPVVKWEWRGADNLPIAEMTASDSGIFTDVFTTTFA